MPSVVPESYEGSPRRSCNERKAKAIRSEAQTRRWQNQAPEVRNDAESISCNKGNPVDQRFPPEQAGIYCSRAISSRVAPTQDGAP
eukprot:scaffold192_cov190-Pinguiococcus_pyrenoidosus.AAC.16